MDILYLYVLQYPPLEDDEDGGVNNTCVCVEVEYVWGRGG
jgi:hypothetical protein